MRYKRRSKSIVGIPDKVKGLGVMASAIAPELFYGVLPEMCKLRNNHKNLW